MIIRWKWIVGKAPGGDELCLSFTRESGVDVGDGIVTRDVMAGRKLTDRHPRTRGGRKPSTDLAAAPRAPADGEVDDEPDELEHNPEQQQLQGRVLVRAEEADIAGSVR